jgi:hypothetical protein
MEELRVTEAATKGTYNYCYVAPPIWSSAPTITSPTEDGGGLELTFTATFSAYTDHRTDTQGCFDAEDVEIQVGELGGDWGTLVYDSGEVTSGTSHEISGLAYGTAYQMRVRHSSLNDDRSTEHWGEWSSTRTFTTASQSASISGGGEGSIVFDGEGSITAQ